MSRDKKRLLVIKTGPLDEAVMAVPALRALRRALPDAEIDWLAGWDAAPLAATVPYVSRVIAVRRLTPLTALSSLPHVRSRRYDATVDFEPRSRLSAILSVASGAPARYGFYSPGLARSRAYTGRHGKYFVRHETEEYLSLAGLLTPIVFDSALELWAPPAGQTELEFAGFKRKAGKPLVLLHPGCGPAARRREWPLTNYGVLGHWLLQGKGAQVAVTAEPSDRKKGVDLVRLLSGRAVDLGGRLSYGGLAAVASQADLVISGDTGMMQIAAAFGKPQVALFGPSDPRLRGPLNPRAAVVRSDCPSCPTVRFGHEYHAADRSCMARIAIEDVKAAVDRAWNGAGFDNPAAI